MKDILENLLSYSPQKFELINNLIEEGHDMARGIFVNRTLRMDDIKYIGFDMDYTLAIYNKKEIEELAFILTLDYLVKLKGYPEEVKEIVYDADYVIRGLVIDKQHGNILKLDRHKFVRRADHGTKKLDIKSIREYYMKGKITYSDGIFVSVDTLFSLPEAFLYAKLVDLMDEGKLPIQDYILLFDDIKECIDLVHRDGSLKGEIAKDLEKYIYKDLRLPLVLDKFREKGKKLFLLTNSEWSYTNIVMNYLLENTMLEYKSWKEFFDIILVNACKPAFFIKGKEFFLVDEATSDIKDPVKEFLPGCVYSYGNYLELEAMIGSKGDEVLYIGDHIYGDILRSNKDSGWRTVLVIQELEEELEKMQKISDDMHSLRKLEEKRDKVDYELSLYSNKIKKLESFKKESSLILTHEEKELIDLAITELYNELDLLERRLSSLVNKILDFRRRIDSTFHKKWGPIFQDSEEVSRFGDQVRDYACIYTSRLSNFFFYPVNNYFKSVRDMMPHEIKI